MFGITYEKERILSSLSVLADPSQMLSNYGIRSLSKLDQFYLQKSNYWRGAIWININFLVLRGLFKHYSDYGGPINPILDGTDGSTINTGRDLYQTIRSRVIEAVYKNWSINHIFWERK